MRRVSPTRRVRIAGMGLALLLAGGFAADAIVLVAVRAEDQTPEDARGQEAYVRSTQRRTLDAAPARQAVTVSASPESSPGLARLAFWQRNSQTSQPARHDSWSLGILAITLALAVCGGIATAVRRFLVPNASAGTTLISRICLSPKHSIHLVQIGQRVLLIGTGPQAAPSLLTEFDDPSVPRPNSSRGGEL
jgi:flagellar biogenesis protein FliO